MIKNEIIITPYLSVGINDKGKVGTFIDGKWCLACRFVVCTAPIDAEINSIDELIEKYGITGEHTKPIITPLEELWVHASNLQAWVDHDYDSHLIHSALGRAITKKLLPVVPGLTNKLLKEFEENWILGNYNSRKALLKKDWWNFGYLLVLTRDGIIDIKTVKPHISYIDYLLKKYRLGGPRETQILDTTFWHERRRFKARLAYNKKKIWGNEYKRCRFGITDKIIGIHEAREAHQDSIISSPRDYPALLWSKPYTKFFLKKEFRGKKKSRQNYRTLSDLPHTLTLKLFKWIKIKYDERTCLWNSTQYLGCEGNEAEYVYVFDFDIDYYRYTRNVIAHIRFKDGSFRSREIRI